MNLGSIKTDRLGQIGDLFAQLENFIADSTVKVWNFLKQNPDVRITLMDVAGAGIRYSIAKHHFSKSMNDESLSSHSLEDRDLSHMKLEISILIGATGGILTS
jgi:hypothetical protein